MSFTTWIVVTLVAVVVFLFLLWRRAVRLLREIQFAKYSQSVKYGKMAEQFMPFLGRYPYDPHRFRFIGTPIDGIQFEDDRVIFVEFKTNTSRPNQIQKHIHELIQRKRVEYQEFRL